MKSIIIKSKKEEWIQSFEKSVQDYIETEDFLYTEYEIPEGENNAYIFKGKYIPESDEIILILIDCGRFSFSNSVSKFQGKFEMNEGKLYLTGQVKKIHPNYIKELSDALGISGKIIFLIVFISGILISGVNNLIGSLVAACIFIMIGYIALRLEIMDAEWKIMDKLKSV